MGIACIPVHEKEKKHGGSYIDAFTVVGMKVACITSMYIPFVLVLATCHN